MSAWPSLLESWSACGLPGLGPAPRSGRLPTAAVDAALAPFAGMPRVRGIAGGADSVESADPASGLPPHLGGHRRGPRARASDSGHGASSDTRWHEPEFQLLRACSLLWHDHLDEAHEIVQDMDGPEAAFVHAIMHRREPDAWNSKYWFRRVGQHPAMIGLATAAAAVLAEAARPDLVQLLVPGGCWDAFAFVDVCDAARDVSGPERRLLERVQAAEIGCLADCIWR